MTYYSTGKSPYLPSRGKAVECTNTTTAEILLKKGSLVVSLSDLEIFETPKAPEVIEVEKPKVVAKPKVKPKGRPKKTK